MADGSTLAIARYIELRRVEDRILSDPSADMLRLTQISQGQALAVIQEQVTQARTRGLRFAGHKEHAPVIEWTSSAEMGHPTSVQVQDCVDISNFYAVNSDGHPASLPPQLNRYIAEVSIERRDGNWMVTVIQADRSRPC